MYTPTSYIDSFADEPDMNSDRIPIVGSPPSRAPGTDSPAPFPAMVQRLYRPRQAQRGRADTHYRVEQTWSGASRRMGRS
jgi:hypothetical protein